MVRYYKTTGLYGKVDLLRFDVRYEKGKGYIARLQPCSIDQYGCIGIHYCPEYYTYFGTHTMDLVKSSRRSAKKEAEAERMVEEQDIINVLIDHFMAHAESKGKTFEVIGELEELRK